MTFVTNKIALVKGGLSGIGLAHVEELLKNNIRGITIVDINENEQVLAQLRKEFDSNCILFIKADVSDKEQYMDAFEQTVKKFNNLDIVINNAGVYCDKEWERELAVNLSGTMYGTVLAVENYLPKYKSGSEAVVINTSSICGLQPHGCCPGYAATKYGIMGLSQSFGIDHHYKSTNVRVITICPGYTNTSMSNTGNSKRSLGPRYTDLEAIEYGSLPTQDPDFVAKTTTKIINEAQSGSVWLIEGNECY